MPFIFADTTCSPETMPSIHMPRTGTGEREKFPAYGTNIPGDGTDNIGAVLDVAHTHYAWGSSVKSFVPTNGEKLSYTVTYNPSGTVYLARLNYIAVNYERALALQNGTVAWGQHDGKAESRLEVSGVTDETQVWDVTTSHLPTEMNVTKRRNPRKKPFFLLLYDLL